MTANWSRCSGRRRRSRRRPAGAGPAPRGDRHGDRRAQDTGQAAEMQEACGEHRAGVPGGHHRVGGAVGDGADGADEEESGFARTASAGLSAIPITVDVTTSSRPPVSSPSGPYSTTSIPRRPPPAPRRRSRRGPCLRLARRRRLASRLGAPEAERLDLAALVRPAGRADAVGQLRRGALRAGVHARCLELMRRPALVAARLRGFPLRDGHGGPPMIVTLSASLSGRPMTDLGRNPLPVPSMDLEGPPHAGLIGST